MNSRYLEITFRNGKPIAAYLYLTRHPGDRSARTQDLGGGILADFAPEGRPIGVEILSPDTTQLTALNTALEQLSERPLTSDEARLLAA